MARNEVAFMERGQTFPFYSDENGTLDTVGGAYLEGAERVFEDVNYASSDPVKPYRSGKSVTCRLVRNTSGTALLPKRFAKFKTDGSTADILGGQVDGYGETLGVLGGVVDEFLPAAGVPDDHLFWLVVDGPSTMTTGASGDTNIPAGAAVVPTTGGKIVQRAAIASAGTSQANYEAMAETVITSIEGTIGRLTLAVNATDTDRIVIVRRML